MLKFFTVDGEAFDVETLDGLLKFQRKVSQKLTRRNKVTLKEDARSVAFGRTR
jgi:hypothetical protein